METRWPLWTSVVSAWRRVEREIRAFGEVALRRQLAARAEQAEPDRRPSRSTVSSNVVGGRTGLKTASRAASRSTRQRYREQAISTSSTPERGKLQIDMSELSRAQLQRLLSVGRSLVAELDLEAVLKQVLEAARELTGARAAEIGELDEASFGGTYLAVTGEGPRRSLGNIYLTDKEDGKFDDADRAMLVSWPNWRRWRSATPVSTREPSSAAPSSSVPSRAFKPPQSSATSSAG